MRSSIYASIDFLADDFLPKIQRLGAEASAGAIADMYENHNVVRITGAYFGLVFDESFCVGLVIKITVGLVIKITVGLVYVGLVRSPHI